MSIVYLTFHNHVVHVNLDIFPDEWVKHLVLIRCPSVFKAEQHHLVALQSPVGDEGGLFLIILMEQYLVLARRGIYET